MGVKSKQNTQLIYPPLPDIAQSATPHRSNSINDILRHQQKMQQSSPNANSKINKLQQSLEQSYSQVQTQVTESTNDTSALATKKKNMRGLLADWMVNSSVSLTYEQILAHHQEQQQQQMLQQVQDSIISQSSVFPQPQQHSSRNIFQAAAMNQPSYNASAIIQSNSQQVINLKDQQMQMQQQRQQPQLPAIRTRQLQESPSRQLETPNKQIVNRTHTHSSSLPPTSTIRNQSGLFDQPLEKLVTNAATKVSLGPQSGQFISNPLDFSSLSRQRLLNIKPSFSLQTSETSDSPNNTPNHIQTRSNTQQYSEDNSPLTPNSVQLHLLNGYSLKGSNIQKWTDSSNNSPNSNPFALKLSSSVFNKTPSSLETTLPVLTASFASNPISKPRSGSDQIIQKSSILRQTENVKNNNIQITAKPSLFSRQTNKSKSQHNNTDRDQKDIIVPLNSNSISKTEPSSKETIEDSDDKQYSSSSKNKVNNSSKISLKELKSQLFQNQDSKLQQNKGKTFWKPKKDNNSNKQQQNSQSTSSSDEDEEGETLNLKYRRVSMEDEDTVQLHEAWDFDSPKHPQGSSTTKIKSILKIKSPPEKVKVDYIDEDQQSNKVKIAGSKQGTITKGISQTRPNSRERKDEEIDAPKPNRKQRQVKKQNSLGEFSEFLSKKKSVNFRETLNIIHIDKGKDVVEKVRRKLPAA